MADPACIKAKGAFETLANGSIPVGSTSVFLVHTDFLPLKQYHYSGNKALERLEYPTQQLWQATDQRKVCPQTHGFSAAPGREAHRNINLEKIDHVEVLPNCFQVRKDFNQAMPRIKSECLIFSWKAFGTRRWMVHFQTSTLLHENFFEENCQSMNEEQKTFFNFTLIFWFCWLPYARPRKRVDLMPLS